ncbi:MAG: hypothetical protein LBI45_07830 [Bacteroidales bacterium]|jgi:hypothetical protein|nr:hypothetical protein [Bacteroidales bacterium]
MKKLFLICFALCILAMGCEKEGVYNPDKKIKRVFIQVENGEKYLSQEWTWEKNLLKKIQYNSPYHSSWEEYYSYEKNKLVKVEKSIGYYWEITYKGDTYDKVEYFDKQGMILISAKFTYEKKKVSRVDFSMFYYEEYLIYKMSDGGFMSNIFSKDLLIDIEKNASKSKSKPDAFTCKITFTYDKDNIKERVIEYSEEDYTMKTSHKFEKYDNKYNPLYRFYSQFVGTDFVFSKNNPLIINIEFSETEDNYSDFERYTITYDYTYNDKFPTVVKYFEDGYPIDTTFYEYE